MSHISWAIFHGPYFTEGSDIYVHGGGWTIKAPIPTKGWDIYVHAIFQGLYYMGLILWALFHKSDFKGHITWAIFQGPYYMGHISRAIFHEPYFMGHVSWALFHGPCFMSHISWGIFHWRFRHICTWGWGGGAELLTCPYPYFMSHVSWSDRKFIIQYWILMPVVNPAWGEWAVCGVVFTLAVHAVHANTTCHSTHTHGLLD